ncbi:hypothetical protein [Halobacterium yunchengense]|uniref:hypothetical protein n=1 Tax=Halobacterium yunchengense TaxID=3108497 RepID=UPI00300B574A
MADLTEFQEKAVETVSTLDDVPMAVLYHSPTGPEMFLQNDHRDRGDFSPHVGLLAAYVYQLADEMDATTNDVLRAADEQLREWGERGVGVSAEHRGSAAADSEAGGADAEDA